MTMDAAPEAMAPPAPDSRRVWLRKNILKSPVHMAISAFSLLLAGYILFHALDWAIFSATWRGDSQEDCLGDGACWPFVFVRFNQFMFGFYPDGEQWRIELLAVVIVASLALALVPNLPRKRHVILFLVFGLPFFALWMLHGGLGLPEVPTSRWGGLMLTLTIAVTAITLSLPIGTALALARRSRMTVISGLAIGFIEILRAVPLISVLFMASVLLPLFMPPETSIDKLLRTMIGITLFAAAYMAEVVRGGLQAVPDGQSDAAKSLGLSVWKMNAFIILPQALRLSIPGIVNTFIGIFKDTSLVIVIGLFDLLGMINAAVNDTRWIGMEVEGYVFAAAIYWVFCASMSRLSLALEKRSHFGH